MFALSIHYSDVIMGAIASQITSLTIVYSTVYSGDKPLPEPMQTYCQLDPREYISMKFLFEIEIFPFKKMRLNMSAKWQPFCLGGMS